ncbi:MAG: septal ring lytic transglycosylase RlpA family protein [Rhodospirillaceae bacterium]
MIKTPLFRSHSSVFIGLLIIACLSGCAETKLAFHTVKKISGYDNRSLDSAGSYKVGKPYSIKGVWYYPTVNYNYTETGIASWYGPNFHGRKTANGEIFDMNLVSAAHRTLPMPSIVRVTNLKNGRALRIRVNDRGPFAHGRIIDLSRRAAQLLGFIRQGTVPVRVEILPAESRVAALEAQGGPVRAISAPIGRVKVASLSNEKFEENEPTKKGIEVENKPLLRKNFNSEPTIERTTKPLSQSIYIQAGAFLDRNRADVLKYLLEKYGRTQVVGARVGEQNFYRVRIGPVASIADSDQILEQVIEKGYPDARIVID